MFLCGIFEWLSDWWRDGNSHERLASVAIISAIILTVFRFLYRRFRKARWFKAQFTLDAWEPVAHGRRFADSITIGLGKSQVIMGVNPREGMEVSRFDVVLVTKQCSWKATWKLWKLWSCQWPRAGPTTPVTLDNVVVERDTAPTLSDLGIGIAIRPDKQGGFVAQFGKPFPVASDENLWIIADIYADATWEGYLSFRSPVERGDRGHARGKVAVIDQPTPDTEGSRPSVVEGECPETAKDYSDC